MFLSELKRNAPYEISEIVCEADGLHLVQNGEVDVCQYEVSVHQFADKVAPLLDANGYKKPSMLGKDRDKGGNFVWRLVRSYS